MEPAKITDEMAAYFEGVKQTYKAPPSMENCEDLDVVIRPMSGSYMQIITTAWEPTEEELELIKSGEGKIFFHLFFDVLPPISVTVEKIS